MLHSVKVAVLSTCFLALTACPERTLTPINVAAQHPERFVCEAVPAGHRPAIAPEYQIDWSHVVTVEQARGEHDAYVRSVRSREGVVAGYIVDLEGRLFTCGSNMQWQRDFYAALPR